ncbi:DAGLA [Symbiodinium pilosum]|uniref:sn-1-specific diacylglycerol lipase n=1 Tax=Symbiodinium pilosum TaxID=2952 RepID=A0A812QWN2_SYMPI|nr:DAGLA [Symbiodinium pilosum]
MLQGRLGSDELYISDKVEGNFAMLRRLIDLSCSDRKPYSEARALLDKSSVASRDVPGAELAQGLKLLPFAEVTYEADEFLKDFCQERGHQVLVLEATSKPGTPAHFLCFDSEKKEAILSVRGTAAPADALTDLAGCIEEREVANGKLYAHAGFLASAESVLRRVAAPIRDLLAPLGYGLTVTGHSLGASTACLVTRLLQSQESTWTSQLASIRCVAFAPCPCMDATNAALCAEGTEEHDSLVLSFVCNDDVVPRISMQNLGRLSLLGKGASVEEVIQLATRGNVRETDQQLPGKVVVLHHVPGQGKDKDTDASSEQAEVDEDANAVKDDEDGDEKVKESKDADKAPGKWTAWLGSAEDFPEIGYIELAPDGIKNHMAPYYREALAVVAAGRGVAIEAEPRVDETFLRWYKRAESQ